VVSQAAARDDPVTRLQEERLGVSSSRRTDGLSPEQRLAVRRNRSQKIVEDFEKLLREERKKLSLRGRLAQAIDYSFNRWDVFTRFLQDGRICLLNNAVERALRSTAAGRCCMIFRRR
jgi:transposase